jgi:high-affinity Fe2+/Pb2+ permease
MNENRAPLAAWIPGVVVAGMIILLVIGWLIYR